MILAPLDLDAAYNASLTCTGLKAAFNFCKKDHLSKALEGVEVDAMAYYLSSPSVFQSPLSNRAIQLFLKKYQHSLESGKPLRVENDKADHCIDWLISVHIKEVLPLMRAFEPWSMLLKTGMHPEHGGGVDRDLSATEKVRILKAIYRHGIYVNMFRRDRQNREGIFNRAQVRRIFLQPFPRCEAEAIASVGAFIDMKGHNYSFPHLIPGSHPLHDAPLSEAVQSLEISSPIVNDFSPEELGGDEENGDNDTIMADEEIEGHEEDEEEDEEDMEDEENDGIHYNLPDDGDTVEEVNWSYEDDAQNDENMQDVVRWAKPSEIPSTEATPRAYLNLKDTMRSYHIRYRIRTLELSRRFGFSVWDDDRYEGLPTLFDAIVGAVDLCEKTDSE